ncbi:MAG: hypothetical protein ABUK01_19225 [Leptospirales bacterium]
MKKAVSFIFEQAKKLAMAAIDLARKAVTGLIKGLGALLKGLISVVFAAFPEIAKKINAKIDATVNKAVKAVNDAAAFLKKGVAKLLDALASVIDGLLSIVQGAFDFALGAMSLIVKGEFGKLGQYIVKSALKMIGGAIGGLMKMMGISQKEVDKIIEDPIAFLGNLVGAVRQGINRFKTNVVKHLTSGLAGWLFGAFGKEGIQLPTSFNLPGVFSFLAQLFHLTYDAIRNKLVKKIGSAGATIVGAFETGSNFMVDFAKRGPLALWEKVQDSLSNIKEMLFGSLITWLRNTIIVQAITKLVSFFNPVGAIVQAVQAIYNVAMFFKERWEQIKSFGQAVFSSIKNIAAGSVGAAAGFIEGALGKAIPIIISFLARLLNISGVVKQVKGVIDLIRKPISKAVKKVVGWLAKMAKKAWKGLKKIGGKLLGKGKKKSHSEIMAAVKKKLSVPTKSSEPAAAIKEKKAEVKSLKQKYQPMLKAPIKLSIKMDESVGGISKDGDIDFDIKIAPNTLKDKTASPAGGGVEEELNFRKLNIKLPNKSGKSVQVRKEKKKNIHVGNQVLNTFIKSELKIPSDDKDKKKLIKDILAIESKIEPMTREDATGTVKSRENQIINELTAISKLLIQLMGIKNLEMPAKSGYIENGNNNSIAKLHQKNMIINKKEEAPSKTSPEWNFLKENKKTGRGNKDFMRMHLNYAKLGGSNQPKNWIVAPQWINKSPVITSVETAASNFVKKDPSNVIWYKAEVKQFYTPKSDWVWGNKPLTKFPNTVVYSFGKYEVQSDGKTWKRKNKAVANSGSVPVPPPTLVGHEIPSLFTPSITDYFKNNSEEGKKALKAHLITKEHVNMMKSDGVRGTYENFVTLEQKLNLKFPDQKNKIKRVVKGLKKVESEGYLRW